MKRKRVLLVHLGYTFGGVPTYLGNLAELLRDDIDIVCLCSFVDLASRLRQHGIDCLEVPQWLGVHRGWRTLVAPFYLAYAILRYHIEIVCLNGSMEGVLVWPSRMLGCRVVYTVHMPLVPESGRLKHVLAHKVISSTLPFAHKVVCVSQTVAEDVSSHVLPSRIVVIRNWVSKIPVLEMRTKKSSVPLRLLFVGRLEAYKGMSLILDAMRENSADELSLTVVGDGSERRQLEDRAKGLRVSFVGFVSDPSPFYKKANLFINPTLFSEGSPLVTLEAMSYALPCILSDVQINREITQEGKIAPLFRSGDAGDLSKAISKYVCVPELLTVYGNRGRTLVEEKHSARVAKAAYVQMINSVMNYRNCGA